MIFGCPVNFGDASACHVLVSECVNNPTVMAVSLTRLVQGGLYGNGVVFGHLWICV